MKAPRPVLHGRDHGAGGADQIPGFLSFNDGATPAPLARVAATGDDAYPARRDHVHAAPTRIVQVKVFDDATALSTGDGKLIFVIPPELNGLDLVDADAYVTTVSSSGLPTIQIRNVTDAVDMLSTRITIDASEFTSYTAAAAAVIDATKDDVATGDRIAIDVDVAGTGAKGLGVVLSFA